MSCTFRITRLAAAGAIFWLHFALPLLAEEPSDPRVPPPLSPADALRALKVPEDLAIDQVLAEPTVRQPVALSFDERGRLWVVQYLQYPAPAGLKALSHDSFWRTVYDRVPAPPPHHVRGLDRITIHEDTDGDGIPDLHKTFLEGLNIATSVAQGRGGVWIMNPPYLLFYPDRDRDDRPDGDPEVHLEGFGLEDTHSVANSLTWGPDGWLYGAQGSTVSGAIRRPGIDTAPLVKTLGQLIWRYHPESRRFEIFAEGGGNAFGVEIDVEGRLFSGHNGGDTRGFHYVQGGYYQKGFGKHGPLSNPHAFGYFPAMSHPPVARFTHTFLIYEGTALPERYRGKLFGPAPLLAHVVWSELEPSGSTVKTHDLGKAVESTDPWFRPVDIKHGPDGAIYIADWYDNNVNHYRNHEGHLDTSNGRIYRLRARDARPSRAVDLGSLPGAELVRLLEAPDRWRRATALRLLGDRRDATQAPALRELLGRSGSSGAAGGLWALHQLGVLTEPDLLAAIAHPSRVVRAWAVRLACDGGDLSPELAARLTALTATEPEVTVRSQLACSARRVPAGRGLPIVRGLLRRAEDTYDPHLPLLLWWALEAHVTRSREEVLALFDEPTIWQERLSSEHLIHRLARRLAATGARIDLEGLGRLFTRAPDPASARALARGFEEAFAGRSLVGVPEEILQAVARAGASSPLLDLRRGKPEALERALALVAKPESDPEERRQTLRVLGELREARAVQPALAVLAESRDEALTEAALGALAPQGTREVGAAIVASLPRISTELRAVAAAILASRPTWALDLLERIEAGTLERGLLTPGVVLRIRQHRDERLKLLATRVLGVPAEPVGPGKEATLERIHAVISREGGQPSPGRKRFRALCARCHKLFGEGGEVGPDLTPYQRSDPRNLLLSIVQPGAEIREGYQAVSVVTTDGRALAGVIVERDANRLVLRDAEGQLLGLGTEEIAELAPLGQSIMPEGLLDSLKDEELRDLFAYLRSSQPLSE